MASDDLNIEVVGAGSLAPGAREALEACLKEHGRSLLDEAHRLEAGMHVGPGDPMITNSMIQEAHQLARRGHIQPRTPPLRRAFSVLSYAAAAVAGVFAGNITSPTGSIGFAVSIVVGLLAIHMMERSR